MALRDLFVRIKGDKSGLDSALTGAKSSVNSFGSVIKKIGGLLAAAFGVREIINFAKESMKLAAEAEGVKNAFARVAGSASLMNNMIKATRGAVDDSDLMALAIKAGNLGIPLKDLGTLFEFATNRAITTGKSVNEMVELIVMGVGGKMPRALKQLGINTKVAGDAFKSVAGIMPVINKELDEMGDVADSAAVRYGRLSTTIKNFKEALGEKLNSSQFLQDILGGIDIWTEKLKKLPSKFESMSREELESAKKSLEANKDSLFTSLENIQARKNDLTTWDKFSGRAKDIKDAMKSTEANINNVKKDITEVNRLLSVVPPDSSVGNILSEDELKKSAEALEKLKKAHETFWAQTSQMGGLPQNNKPTSVFGEKTFGTAAPLSNKLAGSPGMPSVEEANSMGEAFQKTLDTDAALKKIDDFQERLKEALTQIQFMAVDLGTQIAESLGEALGGGDVKELGRGLLLSFANFLSQFGKMLIAVGLGLEAFQASIKTMNPALALIAGVALLATAGAIKGLMSKGVSGSGGGSGGGGYSSGGGSHASAQAGKQVIVVEGTIKGKDIFISNRRYIESEG